MAWNSNNTATDLPPINTAICPSKLFGGPDQRFLPNVVVVASSPAWLPIDGTVNNPDLGPFHLPPHVVRVVYVSRAVTPIRILALTWDAPDAIYVFNGGGAPGLPPGWNECRRLTAEMLEDVRARAVGLADVGAAAGADEWKMAQAVAKVRDLEAAWEESQRGEGAAP